MTLDEARRDNPDLRFALYAMQRGGPVTLEIIDPQDRVYTFTAETENAVWLAAFPPPEPETPAPDTGSIFD